MIKKQAESWLKYQAEPTEERYQMMVPKPIRRDEKRASLGFGLRRRARR